MGAKVFLVVCYVTKLNDKLLNLMAANMLSIPKTLTILATKFRALLYLMSRAFSSKGVYV